MKFIVTIEETVSENFTVEAESAEEAMNIAEEKYNKCEFVLEPGNLTFKQIAVISPESEATEWTEF
ncbi:MAG: hypothetical protein HDR35_09375 [Treponema sp.]|nr:hypothetical protein [Treponema sp.]